MLTLAFFILTVISPQGMHLLCADCYLTFCSVPGSLRASSEWAVATSTKRHTTQGWSSRRELPYQQQWQSRTITQTTSVVSVYPNCCSTSTPFLLKMDGGHGPPYLFLLLPFRWSYRVVKGAPNLTAALCGLSSPSCTAFRAVCSCSMLHCFHFWTYADRNKALFWFLYVNTSHRNETMFLDATIYLHV